MARYNMPKASYLSVHNGRDSVYQTGQEGLLVTLALINEQFVRFIGEFAGAMLCPLCGFGFIAVVCLRPKAWK